MVFFAFAVVFERASAFAQLWDAHQDSGHRVFANATLELAVEENAALLCVVGAHVSASGGVLVILGRHRAHHLQMGPLVNRRETVVKGLRALVVSVSATFERVVAD